MPSANYDLIIEKGATFTLSIIWKDSDLVPINLTEYSARMQIRKNYQDNEIILLLNSAGSDAEITLGGSEGTIDIEVDATITSTLNNCRGVYDLELVHTNGTVLRLMSGSITISPEVTR